MTEDQRLLDRARRGDARAFADLVRAHRRPIWSLAVRMLRDRDDADDVTQRTFLRAWEHLADFEGRCELRSWLYRICLNLCRNHHRDRRRFDPDSLDHHEPVSAAVGTDRLEHEERWDQVRDAVAALPERQRTSLELRIYQGLPFKEVAAAMESTENACKVNFHYAVKALRARLGAAVGARAAEGG